MMTVASQETHPAVKFVVRNAQEANLWVKRLGGREINFTECAFINIYFNFTTVLLHVYNDKS